MVSSSIFCPKPLETFLKNVAIANYLIKREHLCCSLLNILLQLPSCHRRVKASIPSKNWSLTGLTEHTLQLGYLFWSQQTHPCKQKRSILALRNKLFWASIIFTFYEILRRIYFVLLIASPFYIQSIKLKHIVLGLSVFSFPPIWSFLGLYLFAVFFY